MTIKLDFGPETAAGAANNVSVQGGLPVPVELFSSAIGQAEGALPVPSDSFAQGLGMAGLAGVPEPVDSFLTIGGASQDLAPAPVAFFEAMGGQAHDLAPTPLSLSGIGSSIGLDAPVPSPDLIPALAAVAGAGEPHPEEIPVSGKRGQSAK